MPTRRVSSLVCAGSALALILVLGACTPGGQFDPTEVLSSDAFSSKKKLAGEREALFPQGVPGAETGVPPDLVKGYQAPPEPPPEAVNAAPPVAAPPKPKPKPKPAVARAAALPPKSAFSTPPRPQPGPAAWPAPPQSGAAQTAWPAPPQAATPQTNWPGPPQSSAAPTNWPAPPPPGAAPGTYSH